MKRSEEIAWAAGLFEGEGCFAYTPNHVRADLAMTDHDTVRRFGAVVGVGRYYEKKKYASHHQQQLVWRVTDRAGVEAVLEMFRPWLSPRRLARGEEILRLQAEVAAANRAERDRACRNGHLRTPANTYAYTDKAGKAQRACRVCRANDSRKRRELTKGSR
jgi:hypothetical protein